MSRPLVWMSLLLLAAGCKNMQHPRNDPFLGNQLTPPPATGTAGEITPPKQYYEQGRGTAQPPGGFGFRGEPGGAEAKNAADAGLNFRKPSGRYGREVSAREGDAVAPTARGDAAAAATPGKSVTPMWLNEGAQDPAAPSGAASLPLKSTNPGDNPLRQTAPTSRYGEEPDQSSSLNGYETEASDEGEPANPRYQAVSNYDDGTAVQPVAYRSDVPDAASADATVSGTEQRPDTSHLFRAVRKRSLKPLAEEHQAEAGGDLESADAASFGRDAGFRNLRGRVEFSDDDGGWRLHYSQNSDDEYGGNVLLAGGEELDELSDGDFVSASGVLDRRENWHSPAEPVFLVERIEQMND